MSKGHLYIRDYADSGNDVLYMNFGLPDGRDDNEKYNTYLDNLKKDYEESAERVNDLNKNIDEMNNIIYSYMQTRQSLDDNDKYALDLHILYVLESNNELLTQNKEIHANLMTEIGNRAKNVKDNAEYNKMMSLLLYDPNIKNGSGNIKDIEEDIKELEEEKDLQKRNLEIVDYARKKKKHQIASLMNVSMLIGIAFIFVVMFRTGIIGEKFMVFGVGIMIGLVIIYGILIMSDASMRDKRYYDEYLFASLKNYKVETTDNTDDK